MNLFTKQKQTHRLREQTYGYQGGRLGGGIDWEFGTDMYTLLYLKYITRDFPGGPVGGTPHSKCRGPRFHPWSGSWIPHACCN